MVPGKSNSSKVMMRVVLHINIITIIKSETGNAKTHDTRGMINEGSLTNDMAQDTTHDDVMSALSPNDISIVTTPTNRIITRIRRLREPSRKSEGAGFGVEKEVPTIVDGVAMVVHTGKEAEVAITNRHLYQMEWRILNRLSVLLRRRREGMAMRRWSRKDTGGMGIKREKGGREG